MNYCCLQQIGELMNYLISAVDISIDELLLSTVDKGIDELPDISSRYEY